jgi:hypothetical protein
VHQTTRNDVEKGDQDLLARAVGLIDNRRPRRIDLEIGQASKPKPNRRRVTVRTSGIDRLDLYVNSRPAWTRDLKPDAKDNAFYRAEGTIGEKWRLVGYQIERQPDGSAKAMLAAVRRVTIA